MDNNGEDWWYGGRDIILEIEEREMWDVERFEGGLGEGLKFGLKKINK